MNFNYKTVVAAVATLYTMSAAIASEMSYARSFGRATNTRVISSQMYIVQRGDTLDAISRGSGVEVSEIKACNSHLKMWVGEKVRLYDGYTIQQSDMLSTIAWKKGMTLAEMVQYNPRIKDSDEIYAGQKLNVMCREERADKERKRVEEPEYAEDREKKQKGKRKGNTLRFPSGLELAIVTDAALIGEGRYFNGARRIPLVKIRRVDLFQPISKHFVVGEFVRVEEKEEHCIDAKARPYVYRVGGDYYFTHARIDPALVRGLEQMRRRYGKSLELDEGYRPPLYNRCVGGKGPHPKGIAVDAHTPGYVVVKQGKRKVKKPTRAYRIAEQVFGEGGIGQGATTIHVDTGKKRRWKY